MNCPSLLHPSMHPKGSPKKSDRKDKYYPKGILLSECSDRTKLIAQMSTYRNSTSIWNAVDAKKLEIK